MSFFGGMIRSPSSGGTFTKPSPILSSKPADTAGEHTKPTIVSVSDKAKRVSSTVGLDLGGLKSTGDSLMSSLTSIVNSPDASELTSSVADTASKINSSISGGASPLDAITGGISEGFGIELPSIPSDISGIFEKFSTPDPLGDGSLDFAAKAEEASGFVSDAVAQVTDLAGGSDLGGITDALGGGLPGLSSITSVAGLPTDSVITSSLSKVTSPIQSSLSKVTNITDGTSGIIT